MAIRHTAVSYYGLNYEEHARADFREMLEHGCDTVILAITEFDMDFWFPNLNNIIKTAHDVGLRCLADLWGIGKYFGGEQVSLFLQNNIHNRQVSAMTGEPLNAGKATELNGLDRIVVATAFSAVNKNVRSSLPAETSGRLRRNHTT